MTSTSPIAPELGTVVTVRDATWGHKATGPIVSVSPRSHYADGSVREWRIVVRDERTGRNVIEA